MGDRVDNWNDRFTVVLREWERRAFRLGTNDCAHFALDVVNAVSGHDLSVILRGQYATMSELKAWFRRYRVRTILDFFGTFVAPMLEADVIEQGDEIRGDICAVADHSGWPALGAVLCPGEAAVLGASGLVKMDITGRALKVWAL
jgi:hypothetical protein